MFLGYLTATQIEALSSPNFWDTSLPKILPFSPAVSSQCHFLVPFPLPYLLLIPLTPSLLLSQPRLPRPDYLYADNSQIYPHP